MIVKSYFTLFGLTRDLSHKYVFQKLDITSLKSQQTKSLYDARSISSSLASEEKKSREKATSSFNTRTSDTVSLPATRHTSSSRHPRTRRVYMGETSIWGRYQALSYNILKQSSMTDSLVEIVVYTISLNFYGFDTQALTVFSSFKPEVFSSSYYTARPVSSRTSWHCCTIRIFKITFSR